MDAYKAAVEAAATELGVEASKLESVLKSKLSKYLNIPEEAPEGGEEAPAKKDPAAIAAQTRANR